MKGSQRLLVIIVSSFLIVLLTFICRYHPVTRYDAITPHEKTLFLKPQWGLGNRLRTMSGAFTVAKRLNARCLVLWEKNDHFPQHIEELYSNIPITTTLPHDIKTEKPGNSACEWRSTLQTLENKLPCLISSCMFEIKDTEKDRHEFYQWAQLTPTVSKWIDQYCNLLHTSSGSTIGLHLRQGDIADARDNHFFGQWTREKEKLVIQSESDLPCCSDTNRDSPTCPSNIETIDKRLEAIKNEEIDHETKIWVATDRTNCIKAFEEKLKPASVVYLGSLDFNRKNATERDMRLALVDMYMLAKCNRFYGSYISSFTKEVEVIQKAFRVCEKNKDGGSGRESEFCIDSNIRFHIPKQIWIFWNDHENMPSLVKHCIQSWKQKNRGWKVNVLNDKDLPKYLSAYNRVIYKHSWAFIADLLRLTLVCDYGGVWVDATTFCTKPLDVWLHDYNISGCILAKVNRHRASNQFIAGSKNNPLLKSWLDMIIPIMQKDPPPPPGHWVHDMFESRCKHDKEFFDMFDEIPLLSSHETHSMHPGNCENNRGKELTKTIKLKIDQSDAPYFKLSHHGCHDIQEFPQNTIQGYLFSTLHDESPIESIYDDR